MLFQAIGQYKNILTWPYHSFDPKWWYDSCGSIYAVFTQVSLKKDEKPAFIPIGTCDKFDNVETGTYLAGMSLPLHRGIL